MKKIRLPGWLIPKGTRIVLYRVPDGKEVQRKFSRSRESFRQFYDVLIPAPKIRIRLFGKRKREIPDSKEYYFTSKMKIPITKDEAIKRWGTNKWMYPVNYRVI